MSRLFIATLVLHVLVAVPGLGSIASIAIITTTARRGRRGTTEAFAWLGPLLRLSAISLAAMLVTGGILDLAAQGAFRPSWWFRGSVLLLIATGALHGQARRTVRLGLVHETTADPVLWRVERITYAMCALIVAITFLMVVKPF